MLSRWVSFLLILLDRGVKVTGLLRRKWRLGLSFWGGQYGKWKHNSCFCFCIALDCLTQNTETWFLISYLLFLIAGCREVLEHIDYITDPANYDDDYEKWICWKTEDEDKFPKLCPTHCAASVCFSLSGKRREPMIIPRIAMIKVIRLMNLSLA